MGCGQSKGMTIEVPSASKVMEDTVMAETCQAVSIVKSESRQENITTQKDTVEVVSIKSESGQEIDTVTKETGQEKDTVTKETRQQNTTVNPESDAAIAMVETVKDNSLPPYQKLPGIIPYEIIFMFRLHVIKRAAVLLRFSMTLLRY